MKQLAFAAAAACLTVGAFGAETSTQTPTNNEPQVTEEEDKALEVGFDMDFLTAYIYRNAVVNDRPVFQPCVWADWTFADPFYLGFYVWQNYDLTNRRRADGLKGEWNETDFNLHIGTTFWSNDDEDVNLNFEFGHEWFTYDAPGWDTTYEWYAKLELENPIVTPYFQWAWEYLRVHGMHFEAGLKKEITVADIFGSENEFLSQLTLAGDFNLSFGSSKYLSYNFSTYRNLDEDGEGDYEKDGIGGATIKCGLSWAPCDHFSIGLVGGFTSILNETIRDDIRTGRSYGTISPCCAKDDLVWGGFQAKLSF